MLKLPKVNKVDKSVFSEISKVKQVIAGITVTLGLSITPQITQAAQIPGKNILVIGENVQSSVQTQSQTISDTASLLLTTSQTSNQLAYHYSHRSHSSHRSHYSHYSSRY